MEGRSVAETVSNHYLAERDRWSPETGAELLALGWGEPDLPRYRAPGAGSSSAG